MKKILLLGICFLCARMTVCGAETPLLPGSLFQKHAILQRERPLPIWGVSAPKTNVEVRLNEQALKTVADGFGNWKVTFPPQPANSKPSRITILAGEKTITIEDVLIGDVWLVGGEADMELPLISPHGGGVETDTDSATEESAQPQDQKTDEIKSDESDTSTIRYFTGLAVDSTFPEQERKGSWLSYSKKNAANFSAIAYYFAQNLQAKLGIPIGLIDVNAAKSKIEPWIPASGFGTESALTDLSDSLLKWHPDFPEGKSAQKVWLAAMAKWSKISSRELDSGSVSELQPPKPGGEGKKNSKNGPSRFYNAMVAPLVPYAVRGIIWYQGLSNGDDPLYLEKQRALISGWRKCWGSELPFYYVQLAGYGEPLKTFRMEPAPRRTGIRESQLQTLEVPRTGMVVALDLGDARNIQPRMNEKVGQRLARWALYDEYGKTDVVPSGPLFERAEREGSNVRIHFRYSKGGLVGKDGTASVSDGKIHWVGLRDADGKWMEADAVIDGETLIVSHPKIADPKEVSYAWATNPEGANLYNQEGLPASSFKTEVKSTSSPK